MNRAKKFALLVVLCVIIVSSASFYYCIRPKYVVPILMYHNIDEQSAISSLSVSPDNFRKQIQFLVYHNYNVIPLEEFVEAKKNKDALPRKTVVITFDDGYENNYRYAYPELKEFQLPATIFVIADLIGEEGYLKLEQIKEMLAGGIITIGSHTLSGAYLPGRSVAELEKEIEGSRNLLQRQFNKRIDYFCYPIGGFTAKIRQIVRAVGYHAACTTNRGLQKTHLNNDLFALKRIKIKDSSSPLVLWAKLSGYYNLFRSVKAPHQ